MHYDPARRRPAGLVAHRSRVLTKGETRDECGTVAAGRTDPCLLRAGDRRCAEGERRGNTADAKTILHSVHPEG